MHHDQLIAYLCQDYVKCKRTSEMRKSLSSESRFTLGATSGLFDRSQIQTASRAILFPSLTELGPRSVEMGTYCRNAYCNTRRDQFCPSNILSRNARLLGGRPKNRVSDSISSLYQGASRSMRADERPISSRINSPTASRLENFLTVFLTRRRGHWVRFEYGTVDVGAEYL